MGALTALHVASGCVALAMVPLALFSRKGSRWHRRAGASFTVAMAVVILTAGFLWQAKGHLFLVPLGAVSAYLIFSGWRVVARRRRQKTDEIEDRVDVLAAAAVIGAGAASIYLGLFSSNAVVSEIRPALAGIGTIAVCFGLNDLLGFRAARTRTGWLLAHLSGMIAAYVSAVTAFLVINAHSIPMTWRWLIPSALGAGLIAFYSLRILSPIWRANLVRWQSKHQRDLPNRLRPHSL